VLREPPGGGGDWLQSLVEHTVVYTELPEPVRPCVGGVPPCYILIKFLAAVRVMGLAMQLTVVTKVIQARIQSLTSFREGKRPDHAANPWEAASPHDSMTALSTPAPC
jgi:hypothetical protein